MDNSSRLQQFGAALPLFSDGQSSKMRLAFENAKFSVQRAGTGFMALFWIQE